VIESESHLYQKLSEWTGEWIYYERIEPANESGFPDIHFVVRTGFHGEDWEGTIELKHFKPKEKLDLSGPKVKGTQKAALIEYYQAGGKRRWYVVYRDEVIFVYPTWKAVQAVQGKEVSRPFYPITESFDPLHFRKWFLEVLTIA
jgi:hypothetical protein